MWPTAWIERCRQNPNEKRQLAAQTVTLFSVGKAMSGVFLGTQPFSVHLGHRYPPQSLDSTSPADVQLEPNEEIRDLVRKM